MRGWCFNVLGLSVECIAGAAALLAKSPSQMARSCAVELHPGRVGLGRVAGSRDARRSGLEARIDAGRLVDYLLANVADDSKAAAAAGQVVRATVRDNS
jgi:hypothetical protein